MIELFCFGLGYTAQAVATLVERADGTVTGTSREGDATTLLFNGTERMDAAPSALARASHLLVSIPPDATGDPLLRLHLADIAAMPSLTWIGYLSTTGPYGDHGGATVDEDTKPAPTGPRGTRRFKAERDWQMLGRAYGIPTHVFRLAGIYGPGRSVLDKLRAGSARRIVKEGQVFSRIHVADAAQAIFASMLSPRQGRIYNVADDEPAPASDVVTYAAGLLNMEPPPEVAFANADLSPMAQSFYADCKRINNDRIKRELGVELAYPTYREGLTALAAGDKGTASG